MGLQTLLSKSFREFVLDKTERLSEAKWGWRLKYAQ